MSTDDHVPGTAFKLNRGVLDAIPPRPKRGKQPIVYANNPVAMRGDQLGEVWWQGRQWAVTSDGLEARDGSYFIAADRLTEDLRHSWAEHIGLKTWVDVDDFETAWLIAIALHASANSPGEALAAIRRAPPPQPPEDYGDG